MQHTNNGFGFSKTIETDEQKNYLTSLLTVSYVYGAQGKTEEAWWGCML